GRGECSDLSRSETDQDLTRIDWSWGCSWLGHLSQQVPASGALGQTGRFGKIRGLGCGDGARCRMDYTSLTRKRPTVAAVARAWSTSGLVQAAVSCVNNGIRVLSPVTPAAVAARMKACGPSPMARTCFWALEPGTIRRCCGPVTV